MTETTNDLAVLSKQAWQRMKAYRCANCKAKKMPGHAFCDRCFQLLPEWIKAGMLRMIKRSYVKVEAQAREFLASQKPLPAESVADATGVSA